MSAGSLDNEKLPLTAMFAPLFSLKKVKAKAPKRAAGAKAAGDAAAGAATTADGAGSNDEDDAGDDK